MEVERPILYHGSYSVFEDDNCMMYILGIVKRHGYHEMVDGIFGVTEDYMEPSWYQY